jgi:hypothetical protein
MAGKEGADNEVYHHSKNVRFSDELDEKIIQYLDRMRGNNPGVKLSFGDAVRSLVIKGLESFDAKK